MQPGFLNISLKSKTNRCVPVEIINVTPLRVLVVVPPNNVQKDLVLRGSTVRNVSFPAGKCVPMGDVIPLLGTAPVQKENTVTTVRNHVLLLPLEQIVDIHASAIGKILKAVIHRFNEIILNS